MNENETKEKKVLSKNDTMFYRLLVLFVYAIISIIGINTIRTYEINCRKVFSSWIFIAGMIILFLACLYVIIKKIGSDKLIRLNTIAKVCAPITVMFALYTSINNANLKTEYVIIATIVLAFVMIVYPKNFFNVAIAVAIEYFAMYCIYYASPNVVDKIFFYISYPVSILVPLCVIALVLIGMNKKELSLGKINIEVGDNKLFKLLTVVLMAICIISAILTIFVPVTYAVVHIVLLASFIIVGVICTIKLI